jgi:DNA-binding winged helix-turn-helix (wHTH) protein
VISGSLRTLTFGRYRLVLRPHPVHRDRVYKSLFRGKDHISAEPQQLELLRLLVDDYPGEPITAEEIANILWPDASQGINLVQRQISELRRVLQDDPRRPFYIKTLEGSAGYRFIEPVRVEGDLGRLDGLLNWSTSLFVQRLDELQRHEDDSEDLRIVTVGLVPSPQDIDLGSYLRRGIRTRIVMMNPENRRLLESRYSLRQDEITTDRAQHDIRKQIDHLKRLMAAHDTESLEVRLSDAMPSGLIVHSHAWALLGIFPAQGSYVLGPMVTTTRGDSLWQNLYDDWRVRWDNPSVTVKRDRD